jgi:hypothetical protein
MRAEKYDWRAKMKEAGGTVKPPAEIKKAVSEHKSRTRTEKYDWRSKIKEAIGIVETPARQDTIGGRENATRQSSRESHDGSRESRHAFAQSSAR